MILCRRSCNYFLPIRVISGLYEACCIDSHQRHGFPKYTHWEACKEKNPPPLPPKTYCPCVVVTGFTEFKKHQINASWEAVKLLPDMGIEQEFNVLLVTIKLPVIYDQVAELIPDMWRKLKPLLMIHVGVMETNTIQFLKEAHTTGYRLLDESNRLPFSQKHGRPEVLKSSIDLSQINSQLNSDKSLRHIKTQLSDNSGMYLLEYAFSESLKRNPARTIALYVSHDCQPHTTAQIATFLRQVICVSLNILKFHAFDCNCH